MGFFSLLTELVYADLVQRGHQNLRLGHTTMKTTFTQIYSSRNNIARSIEEKPQEAATDIQMPAIEDARLFRRDIYEGTHESSIMRWIHENAE
jgi:thymidylate synthase